MTGRSLATLAVAVVVFVGGLYVGVQMLTTKADTTEATPTCTRESVAKGEKLTSNLVTVNVLNASTRSGLANRVNINLQRKGFLGGEIGNSTSKAKADVATVLTRDKSDPRVRLVAAQFGSKVAYAAPDISLAEGVTVVVGDGINLEAFERKTATQITSDRALTVCVPTVTLP